MFPSTSAAQKEEPTTWMPSSGIPSRSSPAPRRRHGGNKVRPKFRFHRLTEEKQALMERSRAEMERSAVPSSLSTSSSFDDHERLGAGGRDGGEDSYIVIRSDAGPAQVYRRFEVPSGDRNVVLSELSPVQDVVRGSTIAMDQDGRIYANVSLDGPAEQPLKMESEGDRRSLGDLLNRPVRVFSAGTPADGILRGFDANTVTLWLPASKQWLTTRFSAVVSAKSGQIEELDTRPQHLRVELVRPSPAFHVHYQLKAHLLSWSPSYKMMIHPNGQQVVLLQAMATVKNESFHDLDVRHLHLRSIRADEEESSQKFGPVRMMAMAESLPSAPRAEPKLSEQLTTEAEFHAVLCTPLKARRQTLVDLFTIEDGKSIELESFYEATIDISRATPAADDQEPGYAPQWKLKVGNQTPEHWPAGPMQLVVLGEDSAQIDPSRVRWLATRNLPSVPARGGTALLTLPSPWEISIKHKITVERQDEPGETKAVAAGAVVVPPTKIKRVRVVSTVWIELDHHGKVLNSRFPLILYLQSNSLYSSLPNLPPPKPEVVDKSLEWLAATPPQPLPQLRMEHTDDQWRLVVESIPPSFRGSVQVKFSWTTFDLRPE